MTRFVTSMIPSNRRRAEATPRPRSFTLIPYLPKELQDTVFTRALPRRICLISLNLASKWNFYNRHGPPTISRVNRQARAVAHLFGGYLYGKITNSSSVSELWIPVRFPLPRYVKPRTYYFPEGDNLALVNLYDAAALDRLEETFRLTQNPRDEHVSGSLRLFSSLADPARLEQFAGQKHRVIRESWLHANWALLPKEEKGVRRGAIIESPPHIVGYMPLSSILHGLENPWKFRVSHPWYNELLERMPRWRFVVMLHLEDVPRTRCETLRSMLAVGRRLAL
ncbi:hypothetical protein F5X99DRAFT_426786 [Biscogniauxia marginata]|nr:hypothetical protein F5X99DRAFT_426786 [Biscogniauxia marginata]